MVNHILIAILMDSVEIVDYCRLFWSLAFILCISLLGCMREEDAIWKLMYLLPGKLVPSPSEQIVSGKQVKDHLSNVKTKF